MDELVRWLTACLDEDERIARKNSDGRGLAEGFPDYRTYWDGDTAAADEYIDHFDPVRILHEVDAKRKLLHLHGVAHRNVYWLDEDGEEGVDEIPACGHCVPRHSYLPHHSKVPEGPCTTIRLLALPYADRPGYREEWAP